MSTVYTPKVDRRTTLKWVASAVAASAAAGCGRKNAEEGAQAARLIADLGQPGAPSADGYGTDPDLLNPVAPWNRTMTEEQLRVASALSDMIIPEEGGSPSASAVGVPDFINEWVSAPYKEQQSDRKTVFDGLTWIEQESLDRFGVGFAEANDKQRAEILDDIAWPDRVKAGLEDAAQFFGRFRFIVMGAFFSTEAGVADIGYIGNQPMAGDYPGPTPEAMAHLNAALVKLGLAPFESQ